MIGLNRKMAVDLRRLVCGRYGIFCLSLVCLCCLLPPSSSAFVAPAWRFRTSYLKGAAEWRELPDGSNNSRNVLLLPFPIEEALLIGQSSTIILKDGRFFDLFQDALDHHEGVIGMALMSKENESESEMLLATAILCEISDYQVDAGFRGRVTVQVTLTAVSRATLLQIVCRKPTMVGVVSSQEIQDDDTRWNTPQRYQMQGAMENILRTFNKRGDREAFGQTLERCAGRTQNDPEALSWAALIFASDPPLSAAVIQQAIACTSAAERLRLAEGVLLDQKFMKKSGNETASNLWPAPLEGFQ